MKTILVVCCTSLLVLTSCSRQQAAGVPADEVGRVRQALPWLTPESTYGLELGQGISMDRASIFDPVRKTCVDAIPVTLKDPINEIEGVAFSTRTKVELSEKLSFAIGGSFPVKGVKIALETQLEDKYESKQEREFVTLVLRHKTVSQRANTDRRIAENNFCRLPGGGTIDSPERFRTECGDVWLSARERGGFYMLTWDTQSLSEKETLDLKTKLGVGSSPGLKADVGVFLSSAVTSNAEQAFFEALGLPPMPVGNDQKIKITDFLKNLSTRMNNVATDASTGIVESTSYGATIQQSFSPYTSGNLAVCANIPKLPFDADTTLACYSNGLTRIDALLHDESELAALKTQIDIWVNPPPALQGRVRWPSPAQQNLNRATAWLTRVSSCTASVPTFRSQCQTEFADWSRQISSAGSTTADVCAACAPDPLCDYATLVNEASAIPSAIIDIPRTAPPPIADPSFIGANDAPVNLGPTSGALCVLSAVKGAFRGGGEHARVAVENGDYVLRYDSLRTANNELGMAAATCAPLGLWVNGSASPQFYPPQSNSCEQLGAPGSTTCAIPATRGFAVLSGIKGSFDEHRPPVPTAPAIMDFVRIERQPQDGFDGQIRASMEGGGLIYADWMTGGIEIPSRASTNFTRAEPFNLVRSGQQALGLGTGPENSLCFLNRVGGFLWESHDGALLTQSSGLWVLSTHGACWSVIGNLFGNCERRLVEASARCVPFNQQ